MKKLVLAIGLVLSMISNAQNSVQFDIEVYDLTKIKFYNIENDETNNFIIEFLITEFDKLKGKKLIQSDIDLLFDKIIDKSYHPEKKYIFQTHNDYFYTNDFNFMDSVNVICYQGTDLSKNMILNNLNNTSIQSIEYYSTHFDKPNHFYKRFVDQLGIKLFIDNTLITYTFQVCANNIIRVDKHLYHIIAK